MAIPSRILTIPSKYEGSKCKADDCISTSIKLGENIIWASSLKQGKGSCYHIDCWNRVHSRIYPGTHDYAWYKAGGQGNEPAPSLEEMTEGMENEVPQNEPVPEGWERLPETPIPPVPPIHVSPSAASTAMDAITQAVLGPLSTQFAELAKLDQKIKDAVSKVAIDPAKIEELVKKHIVREVVVTNPVTKTSVNVGTQHQQFEILLRLCSVRVNNSRPNIWLSGPAGSGKTTAAMAVAKALDMPFYFTGAIMEPYSLLGFKAADGAYQRTQFREAYETGGIFLFDEVDSSDPIAVMPFNAALANGHCAFPDKVVPRHDDCIILAAANTWGHGANNDYVGRNKLDGAFLNRFAFKIPWTIDEKLESAVAQNDAWVSRVRKVRANVAAKGIKVLITPRESFAGAALLNLGLPQSEVEALVLRNGMSNDQWEAARQ